MNRQQRRANDARARMAKNARNVAAKGEAVGQSGNDAVELLLAIVKQQGRLRLSADAFASIQPGDSIATELDSFGNVIVTYAEAGSAG